MTVRFRVVETFHLTGHGPTAVGILEGDGIPFTGTTLELEASGEAVRIRSFDLHSRQTEDGLQMALFLDPEDASKVSQGSVLVSPRS